LASTDLALEQADRVFGACDGLCRICSDGDDVRKLMGEEALRGEENLVADVFEDTKLDHPWLLPGLL
jgi:hypothetical protein